MCATSETTTARNIVSRSIRLLCRMLPIRLHCQISWWLSDRPGQKQSATDVRRNHLPALRPSMFCGERHRTPTRQHRLCCSEGSHTRCQQMLAVWEPAEAVSVAIYFPMGGSPFTHVTDETLPSGSRKRRTLARPAKSPRDHWIVLGLEVQSGAPTIRTARRIPGDLNAIQIAIQQ